MAWVGAVVGGLASAYGAKESNKAGKNAGKVDVYHEVKPYAGTEAYRNAAANRAYELTFGKPAPLSSLTDPDDPRFGSYPGPKNGGVPRPDDTSPGPKPIFSDSRAGGGGGKGKKGKGGGGGKGAATPGTTKQAIDNAMRVAGEMEDSPTVTAAQDYAAGTLRGEDQNPYREETAGMLRDLNETGAGKNYQRLLDELWGSDTGVGAGRGSSSDGGGGDQVVSSDFLARQYGPGGGGAGAGGGDSGLVGVQKSLQELLAGNDSPAMQAMREKIKRQGDEALAEQQKALRLRASGSGNYGGSGQDYAEGTAMGRYGGYLADANAQMYSDLYGQALGYGTQYDISAQDRAAQERMAAQSLAASARSSAGAGRSAQRALESQERMQRLSLLANLTGEGLENERFRASGFGSLGEGFSGDQRNALSLAGDTNSLGQQGWLQAGGLSLGKDQTSNQLRASLANTGVARQSLEFDKYRYGREAPMRDLAQYSGLISGLYDPYATSHDFGFDARSQSPSYSNVAMQGLAGAAAGYQLGSDMGWGQKQGGGSFSGGGATGGW